MSSDRPLWLAQVQEIVNKADLQAAPEPGTTPYYRELQGIIGAFAFRNGNVLRTHSKNLFSTLAKNFRDRAIVKSEKLKDEDSGDIHHENSAITRHTCKSTPFIEYPNEQQFGEVGTYASFPDGNGYERILGGVSTGPERNDRSEIRYDVFLRKKNSRNSISYVKVDIELEGGFDLEFAYECDEKGQPLPSPRRKSWHLGNVGCYKNGEWYEPDGDLVMQARNLFEKYGFLKK